MYLNLFLTIGVVISYIFQIKKLYKNKSSNGFHNIYLFLGSISWILDINNMVILKICEKNSYINIWDIVNNNMSLIQSIISAILFHILIFICVFYNFRNNEHIYYTINILYIIFICLLISLYNTFVFFILNNFIKLWSLVLTVLSSITVSIHTIPQIYYLVKRKDPGSMSIILVIYQTISSWLYIYTIIIEYNNNIFILVPFLFDSTFQTILAILSYIYYYKIQKNRDYVTLKENC